MNRFVTLFLSFMIGFPCVGFPQNFREEDHSYKRVLIQTIGIKYYDPRYDLPAAVSLKGYREIANKAFRCYPDSASYHKPLCDYLKADDVKKCLLELEKDARPSDIIILHILSHGKYDETSSKNNKFVLICNGDSLNGDEICEPIKRMANSGSLVIFFLDACNSEGLFDGKGDQYVDIKNGGAIAFFASSEYNKNSIQIGDTTAFTQTILRTLDKKDLTLESITEALNNTFKDNSSHKPQIKYIPENYYYHGVKINKFPLIQIPPINPKGSRDINNDKQAQPIRLINKSKALLPWTISPENGKGLDYTLFGVECASLIGMIVFSPLIQPNYQDKIDNATNPWDRNDYRKKGKNAAIGFCASAGIFAASYLWRTIHVHKQIVLYNEKKKGQAVTLDIMPNISSESNGLSLVLNF